MDYAISPDQERAILLTDDRIVELELQKKVVVRTLSISKIKRPFEIDYSRDGTEVVIDSRDRERITINLLTLHQQLIELNTWFGNYRYKPLNTCKHNCHYISYQNESGFICRRYPNTAVYTIESHDSPIAMAFSTVDSKYAVTLDLNGRYHINSLLSRVPIMYFEMNGEQIGNFDQFMSEWMFYILKKEGIIVHVQHGQCYRELVLRGDPVWKNASSPTADFGCSGSRLKNISDRSFRNADGKWTTLGTRRTCAPDGKMELYVSDHIGTQIQWSQETIQTLHKAPIWCACFSPDGTRLVTGSADKTICLWDWETKQCVRTLTGHEYGVTYVTFTPDGKQLISGDAGGYIKIWDARPLTPEVKAELEAVTVIDFFLKFPMPKAEAAEKIRTYPVITEEVRQLALKLLEHYRDDPQVLHAASYRIAKHTTATKTQYERTLRLSTAAAALVPEDQEVQFGLALAQYRNGQYEAAWQTLQRVPAQDRPAVCYLTALLHHRLGHLPDAKAALQQFQALLAQPKWQDNADLKRFLHEAVELIEEKKPVEPK